MKTANIVRKFADRLRPLTPNSDVMSDEMVVQQWEMDCLEDCVEEYGDICCTCGHPIKHVYSIHLINDPTVKHSPVGSECIIKVFGHNENELKKIKANIKISEDLLKMIKFFKEKIGVRSGGRYCLKSEPNGVALDEESLCAENGFSRQTVLWLQERMSQKSGQYMERMSRARTRQPKTVKQAYLINYIMTKEIVDVLKRFIEKIGVKK